MEKVIETKLGRESIFTVQTIIGNEVMKTRKINIQIDIVDVSDKTYYLIYDSTYNLISDAYDYLNHNQKKLSHNTLISSCYALKYLYVYSEIICKGIKEFNRVDFLRLNHFLSGVSADGSEYHYQLLTKRGIPSINSFFCVYREFYRYLGLETSPLLQEHSFSRYIPMKSNPNFLNNIEVPKYISVDEFIRIIQYIRENITDKEKRLRAECIVRIMFEGGCRIGEVLGSTLEDYAVHTVNGKEICFLYIRNRLTDKPYQNAKTCMNVTARKNYSSDVYKTKTVGYQLTFLSMDTYDLICEYIDVAHDRAFRKHKANYMAAKADAVSTYKAKNEDNFYVFLNNRGQPLSDEGWNKELRKIFREVGLILDTGYKKENLNHRFRHGFIMHLIYDLKIPREQVVVRARHRNYASLDAYYNPTISQIVKMKTDIEDEILRTEDEENDKSTRDISVFN